MLTKVDNKRQKMLIYSSIIFFIIQSINGYFIQTARGKLCDIVSFGGVVFAFLFSFVLLNKSADWLLCAVGLFFTVIADWNLVILIPMRQLPAMYAFNVVQFMYFIRIFIEHDEGRGDIGASIGIKRVHIITRLIMIAAALAVCAAVLGDKADLLSMISLFYYANLLCNVVFSFVEFRKNPCFAIGLLCFALCDLFVGLGMVEEYLTVERGSLIYRLTHTDLNMSWIFYVPSYTLIAISAGRKSYKAV